MPMTSCMACDVTFWTDSRWNVCPPCETAVMKAPVKRVEKPSGPGDLVKHWYEVKKGEWPFHSVNKCATCNRAIKPGEVVYIDKKQSRRGSAPEPWFVMHAECMRAVLEAAPQTQYEKIQGRLLEGGDLFG